MADKFSTHYVKGGYSTADDVVLSTTPRTRTVFRPAVHPGGVRGEIIRQKLGANGQYADLNEVNFQAVPADAGVSIDLDTHAIDLLEQKLVQLRQLSGDGVPRHDQEWVVGRADQVLLVNNATKAKAIEELLLQDRPIEFWKALAASNPSLASQLAAGQVQLDRERAILEFHRSLKTQRSAESYWQTFFAKHPWMLEAAFSAVVFYLDEEVYVGGKRAAGRNGAGGVATDFLFADGSTKSFAVVDIKTPDAGLVGGLYRGTADTGRENETYSMHADLTGAIVQVRNQIAVAIDDFESVLGKTDFAHKINRVHPKGVLVVGDATGLDDRKRASLNHFRSGQYSLTIITFDELLHRLSVMFGCELPDPLDA